MIGPLLSVVVSEYKVAGGWPEDEHVSDFTVRCYRNAALVGGPAFEQPRLTDTTGLGNMRRSAYRQTLLAWLRGDAPAVPLRGQRNNVTLLATLYRSMLAQEAGLPGVAEMPLVTSQLQT
jgi:hypothetical protein